MDCANLVLRHPEKCLKLHDGQMVGAISCHVSCGMVQECVKLQGGGDEDDDVADEEVDGDNGGVDDDNGGVDKDRVGGGVGGDGAKGEDKGASVAPDAAAAEKEITASNEEKELGGVNDTVVVHNNDTALEGKMAVGLPDDDTEAEEGIISFSEKTPPIIDNGEVPSATNDDVTKTLNITNPSEIANNNNITRTNNVTADHLFL